VHQWVLWVLVAATALHVVEEHALGWQGWASETVGGRFGIRPSWTDFWVANAALIVFAVAAAMIGWRAAGFSLALPALCLINAVGFHIVPSLRARAPNPGFFTATLLLVPIGIWAYLAASADGRLPIGAVLLSALIGAALMAAALGFPFLGQRFGYADDTDVADGPPPIPRSQKGPVDPSSRPGIE